MILSMTRIDNLQSKFCMEHIQNATLAGGVSVGATADMILTPLGAIIMGCLSGAAIVSSPFHRSFWKTCETKFWSIGLVSTLGYRYVTPYLTKKWKV